MPPAHAADEFQDRGYGYAVSVQSAASPGRRFASTAIYEVAKYL